MSYAITEAERKHVATIEDTNIKLVRVNEGTAKGTPAYEIHLTDGDMLNETISLPNIRFEVNEEDDKKSRVRIVTSDATGADEKEFTLDGLTGRSGNPLGLGWRFKVTFGRDEEGFIDKMIVERKNDGKKWENKIDSFSDLTIKNLTIGVAGNDENPAIGGNLTVNGETELKGTLTSSKDASFNGVEIGKDEVAFNSNGKSTVLDDTTVNGQLNVKNVNVTEGTVDISSTEIDITNSHIVGDVNSNFDLSNADITNLNSTNVTAEKLESNETVSHKTTLDGNTTVSGNFTADDLKVNETISSKNINVSEQFEAKTGAFKNVYTEIFDSKNASVTGTANIKNEIVDNSNINNLTTPKAKILSADITDLNTNKAKVGRFEADSIDVDFIDMEEAEIGKIKTNEIRSLDDQDNLVSDINGQIKIGDINKELVLESAPNSDANSNTHNRIKVVCGDNVSHLATLEDLRKENSNGVVDLTTNQTIGGVKRFKNQIISEFGVVAPDDFNQDKVLNVVSRIWDPNDPDVEFTVNQEYLDAQVMAAEYDENLVKYKDAEKKYNALVRANTNLEISNSALEGVNSRLENDNAQLAQLSSEIEELENTISTDTETLNTTHGVYDDDTAELSVLGGSLVLQGIKDKHEAAVSEEERLGTILTEVANDSDSAVTIIFGDSKLESLKDENVPLEDKIDTLRRFISDINEEDWSVSYVLADDAISTIYQTTFSVGDREGTLNSVHSFIDIYEFLQTFKNWNDLQESRLARCIQLEEAIAASASTINELNSNIASNNVLLNTKKAEKESLLVEIADLTKDQTSLSESSTEKTEISEEKLAKYRESYEAYMGEGTYSEEGDEIPFPKSPELKTANYDEQTYRRFKLGLINENVPSAEHDKVIEVGNRLDELHFESDAMEDGEEHIQATIGGKYHKIANLDDIINANFAAGTGDKIIGDADINTTDDNKIEFSVIKNKVKTMLSITPEDLKNMNNSSEDDPAGVITDLKNMDPESEDETIFTIKGSSVIKIEKDDGDENVAVLKLDGEALEEILRDRDTKFDVKSLGENINGVSIDNVYPDDSVKDSIKIKSNREHLIIEKDEEKNTIDLDINVYQPDMDLGAETVKGYVEAYKKLPATSDNLDLIPNAIAVKSLYSDSVDQTQKVQHELDTRVPPSPNISGRYGLVATVTANENGGVSSIYSWDGTITGLPEIYDTNVEASDLYITKVEQFYNKNTKLIESREVKVPVRFKKDWNGNSLQFYSAETPVEYIPKMRIYAQVDETGQTRITPVIKWVPMDYNNIIAGPGGTVEPGYDPNDPNNNNEDYPTGDPTIVPDEFIVSDNDHDVDEPPVEASDFQIITDTDDDDDNNN